MKIKRVSIAAIAGSVVLIAATSVVFATSAAKISNRIQPSYAQMSTGQTHERPAATVATHTLINGSVGEHDIPVGETAVYAPAQEEGIRFKQGDERTIALSMVDRGFDYGQGVSIGYIVNGNRTQLFTGQVKSGAHITLRAPVDGDYSFYVECVSSDPLLVKGISIA